MNAAAHWLSNAFPALHAAQVARAYRRVFGTGRGRRTEAQDARLILDDLALYCGLRRTGFVPGAPDQTAFNEGQRDVLLHVLSLADVPVDALLHAAVPADHSFPPEDPFFTDP